MRALKNRSSLKPPTNLSFIAQISISEIHNRPFREKHLGSNTMQVADRYFTIIDIYRLGSNCNLEINPSP